MPKPLTVDHNKLWKILRELGIPDHLTCLLRNLYAGQEATVRTGHRTTNWFQIGEGVHQGCILSPWLFNFYAEYIMRNARLEETQAGIKIARRNISQLMFSCLGVTGSWSSCIWEYLWPLERFPRLCAPEEKDCVISFYHFTTWYHNRCSVSLNNFIVGFSYQVKFFPLLI